MAKKKVEKTSKKQTAKKAQHKKTDPAPTTGRKVKRRRKRSPLTAAEIDNFRELLVAKCKELLGDVNSMETGALRKSRQDASGDLSSMPIHMADIGSDNFEQEFALGLMDSERKILVKINEALGRIGAGTYGICEGTGEPIPKTRLQAKPWARYCIEYAEMLEKGLVSERAEEFDADRSEDGLEDLEQFAEEIGKDGDHEGEDEGKEEPQKPAYKEVDKQADEDEKVF